MVRKVGHSPKWQVCRTCIPNKVDDLSKMQALHALQDCWPLYSAMPDTKEGNFRMAVEMAAAFFTLQELKDDMPFDSYTALSDMYPTQEDTCTT